MEGGGGSSGAPRNIHLPFVSCKVPAATAAVAAAGVLRLSLGRPGRLHLHAIFMGQYVWKLDSIQLNVPGDEDEVQKLGDTIAFFSCLIYYCCWLLNTSAMISTSSARRPRSKSGVFRLDSMPEGLPPLHSSTAAWA